MRIRALIVAVAISLLGCRVPYSKTLISEYPNVRMQERIKTVCMQPVSISVDVPDTAAHAATFENLISERLRWGGFDVVASQGTTSAVEAPLERPHRCHAQLFASVIPAAATYARNVYPHWDGVNQTVEGLSRVWLLQPSGVIPLAIEAMRDKSVKATSLKIRLTGIDGEELYSRAGGIQLLTAKYRRLTVFNPHTFDTLPKDQYFRDPIRNMTATLVALSWLAGPDPDGLEQCIGRRFDAGTNGERSSPLYERTMGGEPTKWRVSCIIELTSPAYTESS